MCFTKPGFWPLLVLRHSALPASLELLATELVPSVPIDYMDGEGEEFGASVQLRTNKPEHRAAGAMGGGSTNRQPNTITN